MNHDAEKLPLSALICTVRGLIDQGDLREAHVMVVETMPDERYDTPCLEKEIFEQLVRRGEIATALELMEEVLNLGWASSSDERFEFRAGCLSMLAEAGHHDEAFKLAAETAASVAVLKSIAAACARSAKYQKAFEWASNADGRERLEVHVAVVVVAIERAEERMAIEAADESREAETAKKMLLAALRPRDD